MTYLPRVSYRWVYAALAAYVIGFALFVPRVIMVVDEDRYVSQAVAFASGRTTIPGGEILHPPVAERMISNYPPGTSLLQTPFAWALGWRGAVLLSVLSLVAATLLTGRWLRDAGHAPAFALLMPGFLAAALFGRIGSSDMPSAALVAAACWLLWRAEDKRPLTSFAAGLCVGASLLFREPLIVLLAPLALGALLRRKSVASFLILGTVAGVAMRLALSQLFFDSALYLRDPGITFALASLRHTVPVFVLILFVMFPGGALLPFLYRGPRRAELVAAVVLYASMFLLYDYDAIRSQGTLKGVMVVSRFVVPVLPLLVWMAADVWPRLVSRLNEYWRQAVMALTPPAAAGVVALSFAIHPLSRVPERAPLAIARAISESTSASAPVLTNSDATLKYLSPLYGPRRLILRQSITADTVPVFVQRFGSVSVVLLDRMDSEMFRADAAENARFLAELVQRCELASRREQHFGWAQLRVFDIERCR